MRALGWRKNLSLMALAIVAAVLVLYSIPRIYQEKKMGVQSPDSKFEVELRQPWVANSLWLSVRLCSLGKCKEVYRVEGWVMVQFAQVAWCKSSNALALLVDGSTYKEFAFALVRQ